MTAQQDKAKQLIGELIPWGDRDFTEREWLAYLQCAKYLQQLNEHDVILIFEDIQNEYTHHADGDEMQSRVFILLRILFDLPLTGEISSRRSFKGWENWPMESGPAPVNLSWPVGWKDKRPYLENSYEGSLGKSYSLVEEYTYFKNLYNYRNI